MTKSPLLARFEPLYPSGVRDDLSPLVCIGRNISVSTKAGEFFIDSLFITPASMVVTVLRDRPDDDRLSQIVDELRTWGIDRLEELTEDYTYATKGQAFRIIDLMAAHGHLTFSDDAILSRSVNRRMKNGDFVILSIA